MCTCRLSSLLKSKHPAHCSFDKENHLIRNAELMKQLLFQSFFGKISILTAEQVQYLNGAKKKKGGSTYYFVISKRRKRSKILQLKPRV